MNAGNVMTLGAASIGPDASIADAARLMLQHRVSGLPVIDASGALVGMLTEGDLLRRAETGTERQRQRWLELVMDPGKLSEDYVRAHGRKVADVMSRDVRTVTEDTPLTRIVDLMEEHRIKRLPVVRDGKVVGMVSRANLLTPLARLADGTAGPLASDDAIRTRLSEEIRRQPWAGRCAVNADVRDGKVALSGTIEEDRQRDALRVLAENIPGVKSVDARGLALSRRFTQVPGESY